MFYITMNFNQIFYLITNFLVIIFIFFKLNAIITLMNIDNKLSDTVIINELGARIKAERIRKGFTQIEFANIAGVSKGTIANIENGESIQLSNLLKILRELNALNSLEILLPSSENTPMELIHTKTEKKRQRVRKQPENQNNNTEFKWGEDK